MADYNGRESPGFEHYWRALRRRWFVAFLVFLGVMAATVALIYFLPPRYQATATLWVGHQAGEGENTWDALRVDQMLVQTNGELIRSPNVANAVAEELGPPWTGSRVSGRVSFKVIDGTHLIEVTAVDEEPEVAKEIADTYAIVYSERAPAMQARGGVDNLLIQVSDEAPLPRSPVRPRPVLYTALGLMLGVFFGIGAALLADRLDSRIGTEEEAIRILGLPVIGRIPRSGDKGAMTPVQREAFRMLATNLLFQVSETESVAVSITSPGPGEGKTTVLKGLATALADLRVSVVAIDADMRRPSLHTGFNVRRSPGLADHVAFGTSLDKLLQSPDNSGLSILAAGPTPPNPVLFLQSDRFPTALQVLRDLARVVLVDTPPTSVAADSAIISARTDGVILVIDLANSDREAARHSLEQFRQSGAKVLGVVLNDVRLARGVKGGGYYVDTSPAQGERRVSTAGSVAATRR
jgi:capsular exopolysaccharide synthesis family protein